jgi:SAM-dependent methyltransferase
MIDTAGPNAAQIHYWNELAGPKWVALHDVVSAQIRPLGLLAMGRLAAAEGERVLDVGCGLGETTLELGRRVGDRGAVLGVDVSTPMLARAHELSRASGLANVAFEHADAQTATLAVAAFDAVFSRFGVMFFADPVAAFSNIRRALRPGGRLAFVCWRSLQENPWMLVPAMAAAQHLPMEPPDPRAPGPFAFADAARVREMLERAGFARVEHEAVDRTLAVAAGLPLDRTVDFLLQMGPTASALRATPPSPELLQRVAAAVREAIAPYEGPEGVRMPGAVWIVTAVTP